MSECTHDCSSCSQDCGEIEGIQRSPLHEGSLIKQKVIAVVSGKGGVGKSLVTSLMAVNSSRRGFKTAVLDADITGPSIPKVFGTTQKAKYENDAILPNISKNGIKIMSLNMLVENETDPVIWRGPVIAGVVTQFWSDVDWGELDYMFVDMPPGTGDVPLTVFQSLPVDGIIIVTSPQELVSMIVEKAVNMAKLMNIPIYGIVENMSYVRCPDCGKEIKVFGESHLEEIAEDYNIPVLGRIPMIPEIAGLCDKGEIENIADEIIPQADEIFKPKNF